MKVHRGKTHKYLGISLDFSHKRQCQVTMHDYIDGILQAFDLAIKDHDDGYQLIGKRRSKTNAAPDNLFVVNEDCEKLSDEAVAAFHTIVAKALHTTKRARPDISLAIAFLTTQVRSPDIEDWEKLHHLMEYLRGDRVRPLILGTDYEGMLMWYVNTLFAVHPNMHGHTGGGFFSWECHRVGQHVQTKFCNTCNILFVQAERGFAAKALFCNVFSKRG